TVEANIFRMLKEIPGRTKTAVITWGHQSRVLGESKRTRHRRINRVAAMIIHGIKAKLGVIQLRHKPPECNTELPAIAGLTVFLSTSDKGTVTLNGWVQIVSSVNQTVVTTTGGNVSGGEEGTTVVRHGAMPLELVKGFHGQVLGQALGQIQHLDRQQTFLQLCARTAEGGGVDRVDGVDAVLDEYTFTPADYLTTQTDVTGILADEIVVIYESVQQLNTGALLQRVTAGVAYVIEALAAVLGLEVVPVV